MKDTLSTVGNFYQAALHSNKAIGTVSENVANVMNGKTPGNWLTGAPEAIMRGRKGGANEGSFIDAVKAAHKKDGALNGDWDYGKIAGSTLTAGIGYRALTGGGVYRDQNGQTNIAGVPFV